MSDDIKTIEINGVKVDVDLRTAKQIHNLKVGDRCKLLSKSNYGGSKVYPAVIAGFDMFPSKPTIIVAYLEIEYSSVALKFAYVHEGSDYEVVGTMDEYLPVEKGDVLARFDKEITKLEEQMQDVQAKRNWFEKNFAQYFPETETV